MMLFFSSSKVLSGTIGPDEEDVEEVEDVVDVVDDGATDEPPSLKELLFLLELHDESTNKIDNASGKTCLILNEDIYFVPPNPQVGNIRNHRCFRKN